MSRTLPDLIDQLVTGGKARWIPANGWANVNVSDSVPMEWASGDYVTFGFTEWDGNGFRAVAGNSQEDWSGASIGGGIDEAGSIMCAIWSANGSRDVKAARDAVYRLHSDLRSWLIQVMQAGFPAFAIPGLWDVRVGGVENLLQSQGANGAVAVVVFPIPYQARIEEN